MVKKLIIATTPLLIQDVLEIIYYTCVILNFTMLACYLLHNNKIFSYIEYILYRLDKTKIVFKDYYLIDAKLF